MTPLPPIEPYLEKCGKGTAWIGSMIREQMVEYAQQAAKAERKAALLELSERFSAMHERHDKWVTAIAVAAMLRAEAEKIK